MVTRIFCSFASGNSKNAAHRGRSLCKGQAIVEFTLVLPFLLILVGGAVDWGMAFFTSHTVQNAAREGARIAVTLPSLDAPDPRVMTTVQQKLPSVALFSGFEITNTTPSGPTCGEEVTVSVSGTYNFTFLRLIGFTSMPVSRSVTMRYEQQALCI
jgi:Flp pilus assembly protein TadG